MKPLFEGAAVMAAGAIGGLVSVIEAWQEPIAFPLTLAKIFALLVIPGLKGGIAAGVGVYLFGAVDRVQPFRTFFFALSCGLAFPAVLSSTGSYAERVTSQVATTQVVANAARLNNAATSGVQQAGGTSSIDGITAASLAIIEAAPRAVETDVKVGDAAIQNALSTLSVSSDTTSNPAIADAIANIGAAAASQNLELTTNAAIRGLKTIEQEPAAIDPVRARAAEGVRRLEGLGLPLP